MNRDPRLGLFFFDTGTVWWQAKDYYKYLDINKGDEYPWMLYEPYQWETETNEQRLGPFELVEWDE